MPAGLLSLHGEDVTILNDMIVAVEDLRSVEFTLVLVERRAKGKQSSSKKVFTLKFKIYLKYLLKLILQPLPFSPDNNPSSTKGIYL